MCRANAVNDRSNDRSTKRRAEGGCEEETGSGRRDSWRFGDSGRHIRSWRVGGERDDVCVCRREIEIYSILRTTNDNAQTQHQYTYYAFFYDNSSRITPSVDFTYSDALKSGLNAGCCGRRRAPLEDRGGGIPCDFSLVFAQQCALAVSRFTRNSFEGEEELDLAHRRLGRRKRAFFSVSQFFFLFIFAYIYARAF